jgi:hypothetical protein
VAQSLREGNPARLNPDQRDAREVRVSLDDLVRDAGDRPAERLRIEKYAPSIDMRSHKRLLSGLSGPS